MSNKSYMTSDDLIESIKRRASIPESQNTFTPQDFLDILNEEQAIGLVPSILQYHEEFFVRSLDVPILQDTFRYALPYRAVGNKLRDICFVDTSGNEYEMTRIDADSTYDIKQWGYGNSLRPYKLEGGDIVLLAGNVSGSQGSLRMRYYLRPNQLVKTNRSAAIDTINRTTGTITFAADLPDHFSGSVEYDFNRTNSDHRIIAFDVVPLALTINSITFTPADIPADVVIGDIICQAGETIIPNIPTDLHVVLAHRGATRCLESLGDTQGLQNANAKLQEMEQRTGNLIDNRTEGNPIKVVNRHSLLRTGRYRRGTRSW